MSGETRKVREATALWCRYPNEIEVDLRLRGIFIRDWHQGAVDDSGCLKLSSRLLLELVARLPEKSEFKTYAAPPFGRGGDWTELQRVIAATHNELAAYRCAKYVGTPHEYEYKAYISPSERKDAAEEAAADEEFQESEMDRLMSDLWD